MFGDSQWIDLVLCGGRCILPPGQDLSVTISLAANGLDRAQDSARIVYQDSVAVLTHHFDNQGYALAIERGEPKMDYPVEVDLFGAGEPAALEVLAKEHAEVRWGLWVWSLHRCEMNSRESCVRRHKQAVVLRVLSDPEDEV